MDYNQLLLALIPVLVPLIIAGVKKAISEVPPQFKYLLPLCAPVLGAILNQLTQYAGAHPSNIAVGAALGLAGVGVREIIDSMKNSSNSNTGVNNVANPPK